MNVDTTTSAEELRHAMVDKIVEEHQWRGLPLRADVERALRKVPRELFVPGVSVEEAYADTAVITKRENNMNLSSVSAPNAIADMLNQAHGQHILEIGSGGYNAALLREIAGPNGSVTTVDIDEDVTDRARACLDAAGYTDVKVVCADAEFAIEPGRRYDLIIVTVGAWDVPPAWVSQLTDDGTLVVPLRTLGLTRSWALKRSGDRLISRSNLMAGFVPMRGAGAHKGRSVVLGDGVNLWLTEPDQHVDEGLEGVFSQERHEAPSGVIVSSGRQSPDLDLWLASHLPGFAALIAQQSAIDSGLVVPSWQYGTPALTRGATLAYQGRLRQVAEAEYEYVAYAHGPEAAWAAEAMAEEIRAWDQASRPAPVLHVVPGDTPDADLPEGRVVNKKHSRIIFTDPTK
ncbi:methyltransferase, FxLD system [Saccharopolyspora sp. K220]|uniref:methyltransferase, FxLD system n=1 Tax=Saccharopolyspora soli TaxID=2926618 RepID=UPI001F56C5A4|nr:methyltransferase, FxLD system [Saccharopolyspora soli]MCI2424056.1 methyltransferase, FxLD system [Saccharopolyspora soli]